MNFETREVSTFEMSVLLQCATSTVRRMAADGRLKAHKRGKGWIITIIVCRCCDGLGYLR